MSLLLKYRQYGAASSEFALLAFIIMALGMGSIELAQWHFVRQGVSLALLEAGRAAITQHNNANAIIPAFEWGLLPLYPGSQPHSAQTRLQQALEQRQNNTGKPPWQIRVLSPFQASFTDFNDNNLSFGNNPKQRAINNHFLAEQHERYIRKGWPQGQGPQSEQTIFEANTLIMELTWLHQPLLPWLKPLLKILGTENGSFKQHALSKGYMPVTRHITLLMQSHPLEWASHYSGKVLYDYPLEIERQNTTHPGQTNQADYSPPAPSDATYLAEFEETPLKPDKGANADDADQDNLALNPDNPACGVSLCCL